MKSKTAFFYGPHDLRLEEVEVPALKANQVLVKVGACGVCGSDVECLEGKSNSLRNSLDIYSHIRRWNYLRYNRAIIKQSRRSRTINQPPNGTLLIQLWNTGGLL